MVRNKVEDVNNLLFAKLERLDDESLTAEQLEQEIERSKAISNISNQIISNASLALKAMEIKASITGEVETPSMLETHGDDNHD